MPKKLTLREKVDIYENFLHKISLCCTCGNDQGIRELVANADKWSYAHRVGEGGDLEDKRREKAINNLTKTLCDTPEADKATQERQKLWTESNKSKK